MSLNLLFKSCCIDCDHVDVDVKANDVFIGCSGIIKCVNVRCSHMGVCQFYENDQNEPLMDLYQKISQN